MAAGQLPLALGTDTGASVRTPAALCGVVGLKPTLGRLPTDGVFPLSETCDHVGLLTADVDSAALAWDALSGLTAPAAASRPPAAGCGSGCCVDGYWQAADPAITAAAADAVEHAGARPARTSSS